MSVDPALSGRTRAAHSAHSERPAGIGPVGRDEARIAELFDHLARTTSTGSVPASVLVHDLPPSSTPPPVPSARRRSNDTRNDSQVLHVRTLDHVLVIILGSAIVAPHLGAKPSSHSWSSAPSAVWVGPVAAQALPETYANALLRWRMVRSGIAAPPVALVPMLQLGFLQAQPDDATVELIKQLLNPLTQIPLRHRLPLARTLSLSLRTATTARALAKHLAVHPQTVGNHL